MSIDFSLHDAAAPHVRRMIIDLHIHSDISNCGHQSLDAIIAAAAQCGVDGICITDHDTMAAAERLQQGRQANGVLVIVGMEYTTTQGDFLIFGDFADIPLGMRATELVTYVDAHEGALVAAHPFRRRRGTDQTLIRPEMVRIAESINGRNSEYENKFFNFWAQHRDLVFVGGSDAHYTHEIGAVVTEFSQPVTTRQELIQQLKAGNCQPLFRDGGVYYQVQYRYGDWHWTPRKT
jgi:predicted metal-dependent phosphoesterase TrpH